MKHKLQTNKTLIFILNNTILSFLTDKDHVKLKKNLDRCNWKFVKQLETNSSEMLLFFTFRDSDLVTCELRATTSPTFLFLQGITIPSMLIYSVPLTSRSILVISHHPSTVILVIKSLYSVLITRQRARVILWQRSPHMRRYWIQSFTNKGKKRKKIYIPSISLLNILNRPTLCPAKTVSPRLYITPC